MPSEPTANATPAQTTQPTTDTNTGPAVNPSPKPPLHHQINPHIFRAYDIRGIADPNHPKRDITEETAYLIGKGAGTWLQRKYGCKNMAVGHDVRLTGPKLHAAYLKGITATGLDVIDIGLCTSPMMYWATCNTAIRADSGTAITASHNPKEYNGFKIVAQNAHSICGDELQEIVRIIENNEFTNAETPGEVKQKNIFPDYLDDIAARVKPARKLKIVVDCGNGAASTFAPQLLQKIGCEVIELFCEPDGNFPNHEANPEEEENMRDLMTAVQKSKADLGIGFDGDGDRVGIVDEKGHHYSADFMLLLLVRELTKRITSPQIVFDVKVSQAIINAIENAGAIPIMSKTGHSFIESKMKAINAPLGGEVSGHMFFGKPEYYGFDDAFLAAAKIIEIIANSEKPLSQMFSDLPKTFTTPELKAACPDAAKFQIVKELVSHFTALYDCITIDGVRIKFDQNTWAAVRASNTSPYLTLRFEADTREKLGEIKNIMITQLRKYPEVEIANLL